MRKFYQHLIEIDSLTIELDSINLEEHEKQELARLVDDNIHNVVLDAIFSKLSDDDKRKFAQIASSGDHNKIWEFLKSKSDDIEEHIQKTANDFKKKLHEDIVEAKKK